MIQLILCSALMGITPQFPPTTYTASDNRRTSVQGDRGRTKASDDRGSTFRGNRGRTKGADNEGVSIRGRGK